MLDSLIGSMAISRPRVLKDSTERQSFNFHFRIGPITYLKLSSPFLISATGNKQNTIALLSFS